MKTVTIYEYDPQLRPGTLGADFQSDNPNEEYTLRYEIDEHKKLGEDAVVWVLGRNQ